LVELTLTFEPTHTGPVLLAVGVAGKAFTTTVVVACAETQPFTVAVTVYIPEAATVAAAIDGACEFEVKAFGPVQLYVAPATKPAFKFKVLPAHTGVLLEAVGVAGVAFTVTAKVPLADTQPFTVT